MAATISPGRVFIVLGNFVYAAGAFFFDLSETHVYNPRWPPHARFHNGQTMSLGLLLATASLYYLFKPAANPAQAKDNIFNSTMIGSLYCLAGLSAILYPGTAWQDPEFPQSGEQKYLFSGVCIAMVLGYFLETGRLEKAKASRKAT